jgi:hypothetical protein
MLDLSSDKQHLTGEMKLWRNVDDHGSPPFFGLPARPEDVFAGPAQGTDTIVLSVSSTTGKATYQKKHNNVPITPVLTLNATFANAIFVETSTSGMRSLSFTLG